MMSAITLLSSCSSDSDNLEQPNERKDITLSRAETEIINNQIDFSINLISSFFSETSETSGAITISPFAVAVNLSMLSNAASEGARIEINNALTVNNATPEQLNQTVKTMFDALPSLDKKSKIGFANSCWTLPNMDFSSSFIDAMTTSYNAYIGYADLGTPTEIKTLDEWCSKVTNGLITKAPIDNDPMLTFALISAANFKGEWKTAFDKSKTGKMRFYPLVNPTYYVQRMIKELDCKGYENDDFEMVSLDYGNGSFAMHLILPKDEKMPMSEFVTKITPTSWRAAKANEKEYTMTIKLPKFKFSSSTHLKETLERMGVSAIFNENGSLPYLYSDASNSIVKKLNQNIYIETDEEGTKAAVVSAATGGLTSVGPGETIVFDRPFMFVIDEMSTGAILFAGVMRDIPQ